MRQLTAFSFRNCRHARQWLRSSTCAPGSAALWTRWRSSKIDSSWHFATEKSRRATRLNVHARFCTARARGQDSGLLSRPPAEDDPGLRPGLRCCEGREIRKASPELRRHTQGSLNSRSAVDSLEPNERGSGVLYGRREAASRTGSVRQACWATLLLGDSRKQRL